MKYCWNFLGHLILCFSLVMTSLTSGNVWAQSDSQVDPVIEKQKADCAKNTANVWSTSLNKCVGTAQARNDRHAADDCNAIADIPKREACHKALAEKETNLSSDTSKLYQGSYDKSMVINGAYTIVAAINFMGAKKGKSSCTSKTIFAATAVVGLATDFYLKMQAKKKVDELNNKFKLDVSNNASDSQIKALEYLKDEQKTVSEIAGLEKKRNMVLGVGYGAAGLMAGYELATTGTNPDCAKSDKPEAKADGGTPAAGSTTPATGTSAATPAATPDTAASTPPATPDASKMTPADTGVMSKITNLTGGSLGILVLSTIGAVYAVILYKAAAKQEAESLDNMKKIDQIIKAFKDSYANFCPNGRESLSEPKCYCYTADGKENPDRTKSQTCKDLWAKDQYKIDATAGDYTGVAHAVDPVGCVNLNGSFDEKCACKKFVDAKGGNACMKTSSISLPAGLGPTFASTSGVQDITALSNSAANGNSGLVLSNTGSLASKAIMARKLSQDIFKKLAPELPANAIALANMNEKNVGQFAKSIFGAKAMQDASRGSSSAIGIASSRGSDQKISALLKDAEAKVGLDLLGTGKGLANKKADSKEGPNFNYVGDNAANGSQTQNFPDQKAYNYKNNDISKKDDASIFDIISNRYIQSGLKRLFEN